MTSSLSSAGIHQAAFEALVERMAEPAWLAAMRHEAWHEYQSMPMPGRGDEEWIRTDIRLLKLDQYRLPEPSDAGQSAPAQLTENVELAGQVLTVNGNCVAQHLAPHWAAKGVIFCSLSDAVAQHGPLVREHLFTKALDPHHDKFAALHAACWTSGTFLYIPPGVVVDQPLHALTTIQGGGMDLGHTLVVLGEGADATFLCEWASHEPHDAGLHVGGMEVLVGPRAKLRWVSLQDFGTGVWNFGHQHAVVDRDASLQWTVGALGARLAKVNQRVNLVGPGAECQVNGVMFTEGKQHLAYHTLQHHQAPSCRSDFLYKAALQDQSRTVWRGMIKVDQGAQKTDGYQRNDNLMLSNTARADAIPGLEIEADDVRCTHGSTTARVDDELIFYAQARGYTRQEATRMVVTGFFQQVFDRITIDSVREALGRAIARRVREYE